MPRQKKKKKLHAKIFANPILKFSLCFLFKKKSFTLVALRNILAYGAPETPSEYLFYIHQKKYHLSSLFPDCHTQTYFPATTTNHLVSNKHSSTISLLWKQNNNTIRIKAILVNIYWALTLYWNLGGTFHMHYLI